MVHLFRRHDASRAFTIGDLLIAGRRQDIALKRVFADFGLIMMTVQLVIANVVFWRYGTAHQWSGIPSPVIASYLGSTVVQVVGIVLVMTRSLFPTPPRSEELG